MTEWVNIRHAVSVAGVVRAVQTNPDRPDESEEEKTNKEMRRRIAGALVEIVVEEAPRAFQRMVLLMLNAYYTNSFRIDLNGFAAELDAGQLSPALRAAFSVQGKMLTPQARVLVKRPRGRWTIADDGKTYLIWHVEQSLNVYFHPRKVDPAWQRRHPRIDHTWSHSDGIFLFLDLPSGEAGESYRLRVSTPRHGARYGTIETGPVIVPGRPADVPAPPAQVDVELPATRIHGIVTDNVSEPFGGARVRLRGDTTIVRSRADGSYELNPLAGKPTLEISATGFETFAQAIELVAGQDQEINVQLQPIPPGS
jgi:hypothetical protein